MKNLTLTLFAILLVLNFTSCTTDEAMEEQDLSAESLLENFTLSRDSRGAYSLTQKVAEGAASEFFKNEDTNTNEVHVFSSNQELLSNREFSNNNLEIENSTLKVEFFVEGISKNSVVTVEDDDISTSRIANTLLNSYSVSQNDNGTYQFNFEVLDSVNVTYVYNYETQTNEIHLSDDGIRLSKSYSKNYTLNADGTLKVDFVNIFTRGRSGEALTRPRIIID